MDHDGGPLAPPLGLRQPRQCGGGLERFAGRYRSDGGREREVVVAGELLRIRYPDATILEFVPSGARDFFFNAGNDDITFDESADGRIAGMMVYGDGKLQGGGQFAARLER